MEDLLTQSPIKLDLEKPRIIKIPIMQFDTRKFVFKIYRNNIALDLTGYSIEFHAGGTNCYVIQNESKGVSKNKNIVYVDCINNISILPGEKESALMIFYRGKVISTFKIIISVDKSPLFGIEQSENIAYTSFSDLIEKLAVAEDNVTSLIQYTQIAANYINTLKSQITTIQNFGDINAVKAEIEQVNFDFKKHINNKDIHLSENDRENLNNYGDILKSIINILDNHVIGGAFVKDDEGNNVVDDDGNKIII